MSHLDSLTVLSLEQATTLPYMTLKLVMDGARVIRLESPPRGDPNRWVGPQVLSDSQAETGFESGMNAYFLPNNLGKESITLNLLEEAGRDILHRLIREMPIDIFATNQRPDSYKKLGIDYETLSGIKPDLIWVGITGFGPTSNEAAYDPILQARAGLMELTGESNGDPMVFGLPMVDLGAGEHAYGAVMKALYQRAVTGKGTRLDISMFQSAVSWMVSPVLLSHSFGVKAARRGNTHQFFAPVSVYPTSDGFIYLAVGNDRQWEALTGQQGFESLANEKYKHNAGRIAAVDELNGQLSAIFKNRSTAEMIEMCNKISVPVSRVNTVPQVCADPLIASQLVKARDSRSGIEIAIPPPAVISARLKEKGLTLGFPPRLGEHNESVLASLGCDASELKERGII
ncbi:MAG TPA: CoA transferase [Anaerolineales bacterium]|jgi:crotonobetainyl-CoA:carnitine CoA-transferase CaiB-like acyl-CoA transferase|nr:CoA transferase [Anaerolineales bacterium]HQX16930.1 CoA transferase [Anaerolineales bacterium]